MKIERDYFFSSNNIQDKKEKNLFISDTICQNAAISRDEIKKITGINNIEISNVINNFIKKKFVIEKDPDLIELNTKKNYFIGVDIGKNNVTILFSDIALNIKKKIQFSIPFKRQFNKTLITSIKEIIKSSGPDSGHIKAIGISIRNPDMVSIAGVVEKETGVDTFIGPAAMCAAHMEKILNRKIGDETMLYIYSDIGEGVVMKKNAYLTASRYGNIQGEEFRYLEPWDDFLSIVECAKREVVRGIGTNIVALAKGEAENITEDLVIKAAKARDEVALNIVQSSGINLGLRIAYLINLFTPYTVVIGGGIQHADEIIMEPIKKMINRLSLNNNIKEMKLVSGVTREDAVGAGAVSMAVREVFLNA